MAERLNVVPDELRRAADETLPHRRLPGHLCRPETAGIMASLESLGPIFAEFREAGRELLDHRRICYQEQAARTRITADRLVEAATRWEQHDADRARRLRDVAEGGR